MVTFVVTSYNRFEIAVWFSSKGTEIEVNYQEKRQEKSNGYMEDVCYEKCI
jgi:hypothetical protein